MKKTLSSAHAEPYTQRDWEWIKRKFSWDGELFDFDDQEAMKGILELVKSHYYNADEVYFDYFQWEYVNSPAGRSIIWIARHKHEVVGQYVVNRARFKVGYEQFLGAVNVKTLTRRDFRGKGVHIYLAKQLFETCRTSQVAFTIGFPNKVVYESCVSRLGYTDIGQIPLLLKPIKLKYLIQKKIRNAFMGNLVFILISPIFNIFNLVNKIKTVICKPVHLSSNVCLKEINRFDERITALWDSVSVRFRNIMIRDQVFLNWRYCDNPRRGYKILVAEDGDANILAYVVLRVTVMDQIKAGLIVDVLSGDDEESKNAVLLLVERSLKYFQEQGVALAGCLMLNNNVYSRILRRYGFIICPKSLELQPVPFIVRIHDSRCSNKVLDIGNWFVTFGDYDIV